MLAAAPQTSGSAERPGRLKYPDYSGRTGCREDVGMPMPRPQKICLIAPVSLPCPLLGWHNPGAIQVFCHGIEPTPMVSVPPPPAGESPPVWGESLEWCEMPLWGEGQAAKLPRNCAVTDRHRFCFTFVHAYLRRWVPGLCWKEV